MARVWGHSKRASLKKEGREDWQKKVTKGDVGGGFVAKKCDATHSKKTSLCE